MGGGTFDVSLLTIEDGIFEVKATAGDTHLCIFAFCQNFRKLVMNCVCCTVVSHACIPEAEVTVVAPCRAEAALVEVPMHCAVEPKSAVFVGCPFLLFLHPLMISSVA